MSEKKPRKRKLEVLVLSDIHLGTYGCHAKELLKYLKSIKPEKVILNGDIIDIWQFSKRYWPKSHMKIIKHIFSWVSKGIPVYYITGNHDELLRKFEGFQMGSLQVQNKLVLELDGAKAWFFHGDVFDVTMQHSKWLAKLGAVGYDSLILINFIINRINHFLGKGKISLSKKVKNKVKSAVKFINNFEQTAADIACDNGYNYVVCGHIHQPEIKTFVNKNGTTTYLNSGDWVENLTALEYKNKRWSIYRYDVSKTEEHEEISDDDLTDKSVKELFGLMLTDFKLLQI